MKTVEFKQAVEELGFCVIDEGNSLAIEKRNLYDGWLGDVSLKYQYGMRNCFDASKFIGEEKTRKLAELLFEYAATPLDEREEPKKWRIKCPITDYYLNFNNDGIIKPIWSASAIETDSWKSKFTRAEIEAFTFPTEHLIEDEVSE